MLGQVEKTTDSGSERGATEESHLTTQAKPMR